MISCFNYDASCVCAQVSLRALARVFGYGWNPSRLHALCDAKSKSQSVPQLLRALAATATFKPRKDKLSGDPIWERIWHHFTAVKKGQQHRSKMISTHRVKDEVSGKMVWKSKWVRHQKRYMCRTIDEILQAVLLWQPYIDWRTGYLLRCQVIGRSAKSACTRKGVSASTSR